MGPDKNHAGVNYHLCEIGIFGEEPVTGMDGVCFGHFSGGNDGFGIVVAERGVSRTDVVGVVRQLYMERMSVDVGIDCHRFNP